MKWLLLRPAHALRVGAVACALVAAPTVAKADQIDRVLVNDSADVAAKVAGLGAKTIAVLPFQVKIGSQPATFKQGLEGTQIANKLQNLLVLTNPAGEPDKEYTVLGDAAKAAAAAGKAKGKAIDWTTAEGRKALLALQLPVVWDTDKKKAPDTYLTGELTLTADLKGATLKLMTFSAKDGGAALKRLCDLNETTSGAKIRVDRNTLADLGKSFAVSKSVLARPHPKTALGRTKAVTDPDETASESASGVGGAGVTAVAGAAGTTAFKDCPIELTVMASGRPIAINPDGSNNFKLAQTPAPGTTLSFNLKNTGDKAMAVLLTVDGRNVIQMNKDERADVNANRETWKKFVIQPSTEVPFYTVSGFRDELGGKGTLITVDTEESSLTRFATMQPATAGKIEMLVYPANDGGNIPDVTGTGDGTTPAGGGTTTPAGGGAATPAGSTTDTDMPSQVDQATDASPMESMDKSIGRTKSAAAAKALVLKKLPGHTVVAAKKGLQIKPPAHTGKLMGRTKGLILDGGGTSYDAGGTTEKTFITASAPVSTVTITYYTPEMAGQPAGGGSN